MYRVTTLNVLGEVEFITCETFQEALYRAELSTDFSISREYFDIDSMSWRWRVIEAQGALIGGLKYIQVIGRMSRRV